MRCHPCPLYELGHKWRRSHLIRPSVSTGAPSPPGEGMQPPLSRFAKPCPGRKHSLLPALAANVPPARLLNASRPSCEGEPRDAGGGRKGCPCGWSDLGIAPYAPCACLKLPPNRRSPFRAAPGTGSEKDVLQMGGSCCCRRRHTLILTLLLHDLALHDTLNF